MAENVVFEYLRWIPAVLGLVAIWIVIGNMGAKIAKKHATTRSTDKCPQCRAELKPAGQGLRNRMVGLFFLVDIAQYCCRRCGFRQSVWNS